MNIGMFIVGAIIFSIYVFFLIWNIFDSAKKNKRDNYPDLLKKPNYEVMVGHYPHNFKKRKSRRSDKRKKKVVK